MIPESGRWVQSGTFAEQLDAPSSAFVAELMGRNLLFGQAGGRNVRFEDGPELEVLELEFEA